MTTPYIHPHPIKRPGVIEQAEWIGSPEDMALQVSYRNAAGQLTTVSFQTEGENPGVVCLPSAKTIDDLSEDSLLASIRMASLLSSAVPGTAEWVAQFEEQATRNIQTSIGEVILANSVVDPVSDTHFSITLKKKNTTNPQRVFTLAYSDLSMANYQFAPSTQLLVIPGAIKKQFPTNYIHQFGVDELTSTEKEDIRLYVLGLALWI